MPDTLRDLLEGDREAYEFFQSLPMFVQDRMAERGDRIQTKEELSGLANEAMRDGLSLDQYAPVFEDETDSDVDLM